MTSILFLLVAVVLSVLGCTLFLLRHRKPTSLEHGIDSFSREMRALSPEPDAATPRRRTSRPPSPSQGPGQHTG
ncbi:MAG: hypothetical protein WD232_01060 [Acidimicrobiales bacterium]